MRQALKLHPDSLCSPRHRSRWRSRVRSRAVGIALFRDRNISELRLRPQRRQAAPMSSGSTLLRGIRPYFAGRRVLRVQLCALDHNGRHIGFSAYRSGMVHLRPRSMRPGSRCSRAGSATRCEPPWSWMDCDVRIDAGWRSVSRRLIEETNGRKSYWALAHPPGKADFHHSDCFVYELHPLGAFSIRLI